MRKRSPWLAVIGVSLLSVCAMAATPVPVAGTSEEITNRLQREIDRASEQGNTTHVQTLRVQLAKQYGSIQQYALAARQYELILAARPSRHERVDFFVELGRMRDADR